MLEKLKLELPPAAGNKLVLKLSPPPPPLADKQVSLAGNTTVNPPRGGTAVASEGESAPMAPVKAGSDKNDAVKGVPVAKSDAESVLDESILKKDLAAATAPAAKVDSDLAKAMLAVDPPSANASVWSKLARPTDPLTALNGVTKEAPLKPVTKDAPAFKPVTAGSSAPLPSIMEFPAEMTAPGDADWTVSAKEFPEEKSAPGISKWMTPSRSRRNNERKGASAPIDCSNAFGALLGAGGNEGSGSGTGNARSKVTRGSTPSTTNAGATVIVETTTITTPKICPLRLYFGILALICLGAASAHSSYSATTALLSSQWFDSSAMLAAPADAVGCDTPACQCEALKMVYLDLQISDIDTRFFRPGQADCCNLSAVTCNHHGGIKKLKLRGGTSTPSGVIPLEGLKGLVELERLDLGNYRYSSISGTIPGSLATVGKLRHLTLRNSSISGTIPDSLAKVGNLRHLTLTARRLSGTLPAELLGPGRLEELKVTGRISGTVPASYCKSVSPQHHGSEVSYVCYVYRWPCPAMSTDNRGHPALHAGDRPLGETEIVLAYCSASLAWLMGTLDKLAQVGANVTRVNVVAKCGKKPRASELPRHATVETVENVGRNDHTFARFLAARYCTLPASILFLKDTSMGYEGGDETVLAPIGVTRLAQGLSASRDGFACGSHLAGTRRSRLWHVAVEADEFQMDDYHKQHDQNSKTQRANVDAFRAAQRPLRQFWRAVFSPATHARVDAARHAVRLVCYGGTFAATATAVRRTPRSDWIALRDALTRGDNIEEGHFAERLWAVLLSPSPSKSVVSAVLAGGAKAAMGKCGYCSKPFPGLLSKCDVAVLPPVPDDLSETEPDLAASSQADAPHVADGCAGTAASALAASAPAAG